jgi:hypothetical protein
MQVGKCCGPLPVEVWADVPDESSRRLYRSLFESMRPQLQEDYSGSRRNAMSGFIIGFMLGLVVALALLIIGVWLLVRHAGKPAIAHFLQSMAFVMAGKREKPAPPKAADTSTPAPPPAAESNGVPQSLFPQKDEGKGKKGGRL